MSIRRTSQPPIDEQNGVGESLAVEFSIENSHHYNQSSAGRWLISHLMRSKWASVSVFVNAVLNAAFAFAVPILVGAAFNEYLSPQHDMGKVALYALLIPLSQLARAVVLTLRNMSSELVGERLERNVRDELYVSLLGKSMSFHTMQAVGDIMARATNDVREMNIMISSGVNLGIGSSMFVLLPFVLSPAIHPALLLTPTLFVISLLIAMQLYSSQLQPATENVRAKFGAMNASLAEAIDGIETVKGASQEQNEVKRFYKNATLFRDAFVRQSDIEAKFFPLLLLGIASGSAFLHAIILYRQGLIRIGDIITYMGYLQLFGFPTWSSLYAFSQISLGLAASRRIFKLIEEKTNLDENIGGHHARIEGDIRFENITFQYPDSAHPALTNVTFTAKSGQIVAIVGQTGAGKSTLARLVNRTYDPSAGRITIDGIDLREWQLESLRSQISIIEQDIFLFTRTVAENIAFGAEDATQEQIEAAAKAAQAHEFIMHFKDGYQTEVGERGVTLSGGQRQRIALARAFLTDPRILILDDSTSAIDSATEDQIQRAIYTATQGRTTFLITHRLSQIRWADQIIVLRKGGVAAIGTHEELLATSEPYRRIFATVDAPLGANPSSQIQPLDAIDAVDLDKHSSEGVAEHEAEHATEHAK